MYSVNKDGLDIVYNVNKELDVVHSVSKDKLDMMYNVSKEELDIVYK